MQLINLQVLHDENLIREIKFKDGFNIITNSEDDGNQIGKSTALRVLNFCLGSDGESIWIDPETRTKNTDIEELVTSGRVKFILKMSVKTGDCIIERRIHKLHQKRRTVLKIHSSINGTECDTHEKFKAALAPTLGLSISNPTYSSIKNRFVRLDKKTASNIYRYLNSNTRDAQYILYYSYLFGFSGHDDLTKEIQLGEEKKQRESRILMLLNGKTEQSYKDKLKSIDDDIEMLIHKEESFDFKDSQNEGIINLKANRENIANITSEISKLNIRISYSQRTINGYKDKHFDMDAKLIEKIYLEAKAIIPYLKKTLEDTMSFHEQVISKKIKYLHTKIQEYQISLDNLKNKLNTHLDEEKKLFSTLISESHLSGFIVIEKEIQNKREERGRASVIVNEISDEAEKIATLDLEIKNLRENNKLQLSQLNKNIEAFNIHFKSFTRSIFRDFSLSFNVGTKSDTNEIEFSIVNLEKVSGDGSPRAAALAFDMAFVEFAKERDTSLPKFTIQDYLEASDQDKLATLANLSNKNKTQVIVSILKDKLASLSPDFIEKNTVLSLKKSDKFFKIN